MPIRSSYELTRLFLALSDVTRQQLLNQLSEPTSVIDICATFDLLVHEAARHLRRLEDVALIDQLQNGEYVISHYGRAMIPLVEDMSSVHDLLEYWEGHTVAELPVHLHCLPAQLNDQFLSYVMLSETTNKAISEAREFLWLLNYPISRSPDVQELKVLTSGTTAEVNGRTRGIGDVCSSLVINEQRALIFFPGIRSDGERYSDLSNGFMIRKANPTYWLLVDFFSFLWEKGYACKDYSSLEKR